MRIAFLFLIYDEINQEDLWFQFFEKAPKDKFSIYIHYKNNIPLKNFDSYKLKKCLETHYGDISLVYAQNLLLEEALKDKDNYKFIFLSQSCIPVKSFDFVYDKLCSNDCSYFDIANQKSCFPRCSSVLNYLSRNKIYKSSQWNILNREHSKICISNKDYVRYFKGVFAPEEHYFITLIKNSSEEDSIINESTTFCNWDESDDPDGCSPKTYHVIMQWELDNLYKSNFLFARKFPKDCKIISFMSNLKI